MAQANHAATGAGANGADGMTRRRLWRLAGWTAALAVLALVFLSYAQPSLMQQLGDALWACF